MGPLNQSNQTSGVDAGKEGPFIPTRGEMLLAWAEKYSLVAYTFATACCSLELSSAVGPTYDLSRFGVEVPRLSPRQSDVLIVAGTVSQRQAPVLRRIYEQMPEPKWVIAIGSCACCGGFYDNYATVSGIDKLIPCDVYVPGCPPRPEAILDGFALLADKISRGVRKTSVIKPRTDIKSSSSLASASLARASRPRST